MKILTNTLSRFDARIDEDRHGFQITTRSGSIFGFFTHPVDPMTFAESVPDKLPLTGRAVLQGFSALVELDATVAAVSADKDLSDSGKLKKLAEPREKAATALLGAHQLVVKNIQNLNEMETNMLRAALHSPIKPGSIERSDQTGCWSIRLDRADPKGLECLELGRRSVHWAQRVLAQTQALLDRQLATRRGAA
jgi:hypothetical protein